MHDISWNRSSAQDIREGVVALEEGVQVVPDEFHRGLVALLHLRLKSTKSKLEVMEAGEAVLFKEIPHWIEFLREEITTTCVLRVCVCMCVCVCVCYVCVCVMCVCVCVCVCMYMYNAHKSRSASCKECRNFLCLISNSCPCKTIYTFLCMHNTLLWQKYRQFWKWG